MSEQPYISPEQTSRLADALIERGYITQEQLADISLSPAHSKEDLVIALLHEGVVSEQQLFEVLAEQLGVPFISLTDTTITQEVIRRVPAAIATRYHLIPLSYDGHLLKVATSEPHNVEAMDELRLLLHCDIDAVLASAREIQEAIHRYYGVGASAVERLLDTDTLIEAEKVNVAEDLHAGSEDASVISFVNQIIMTAVNERATDIHIEPFEGQLRVRQRIDGVMYEVPVPMDLVRLHQAIVSRIKVMAKLDIAERRLPQDGRIKVRLDALDLDLRVSILPTSYGETVNIRLLASSMLISMSDLGLSPVQLKMMNELISHPHGILFVTGPTGSGKTTSLYACLTQLNRPNVKIITIEDPIEYQMRGITQLQVHPRIGFSFANGLRSMLRHDPDIMMVGEVRDPETAEITIRSALTGHLVFSTLHTNDAAGGVTRLLDMGTEPFLVASSVLGFIAQRLVRVICEHCKDERPLSRKLADDLGVTDAIPERIFYGRGCKACKETGFKGRTAIYEFLMISEAVKELILARASSQQITDLAMREGMTSLRQDGWSKVLKGMTTPEEVLRVT